MRIVRVFGLICGLALIAVEGWAQTTPGMPSLRKQGTATQLVVDGKPFLALAGELGNNTATSIENMKPIWPKLKAANLNTALVGVSWAQIEPVEGKFDFSVIDGVIEQARQQDMHMAVIWFASWKNGFSSYPPDWVKKNFERFPLTQINKGKSIPLLSTFSAASRDADAKAFAALMRHLREVDGKIHTVVMIQVENEVGVLRDSRDRSPAANKAFAGQVPKELMDYLQKHKDTLISEFAEVWKAHGSKTAGTWEEVFGPGKPDSMELAVRTLAPPMTQEDKDAAWRKLTWPADEIFMAWQYARFVGKVAEAGKAEYAIPMYANAWLQQPDHGWPGTYPSGGPLPQVIDIWKAGAPAIDILAPDLYLTAYLTELCTRYTRQGNPLFIPETEGGAAGGANVLYVMAQFDAIGFSPFGIERQVNAADTPLGQTYAQIANMAPIILEHQGTGTMGAVRFLAENAPQKIKLGNYTAEVSVARGRRSGPQAPTFPATAILISTAPDEFYIIGNSLLVTFAPNGPGPEQVGLGTVEEGSFVGGKWVPGRRLAGDDTEQGETSSVRVGGALRVTLYRYR
jgi:beta-galactosidase GanA